MSYTLVYDIGWAIIDKKGNVYRTRSFVVDDIFNHEKELMDSAYYSNKIPQYLEDIKIGTRKVVSWYKVKLVLKMDMEEFGTNVVICHNARFDDNAVKITERYVTKSKYRYFFPINTEVWDSLKMATDTIGQQKSYINFCKDNGYMTKHKTPRPRLTAEILYRYLNQDDNFIESHTALEDVMIEKEIVASCFRTHKKMRKKLWGD